MKKLLGYTDQLTVRPKDTIAFKISSENEEQYEAQLVRVVNGDRFSERANYKEIEVESCINGRYRGRHQPIYQGSCIVINDSRAMGDLTEFSLLLNIMPTMPRFARQHLIGQWDKKNQLGWSLYLTADGYICLLYTSQSPRDQRGSRMPSSA